MSESPLALEGWLEFNHRKWGVTPLRTRYAATHDKWPSLEAVLYRNAKGRLVLPPLNPYLPLRFLSTPTTNPASLKRQWLELSGHLCEDMLRFGQKGLLILPPEQDDLRAWQWAGYPVGLRYTYTLDFPVDPGGFTDDLRRNLHRAERDGLRCERTTSMKAVAECLLSTRQRKRLGYDLSAEDLELARSLVGDEHLRTYLCYAPDGRIASAAINLHRAGGRALGIALGTPTSFLSSGAAQKLIAFILEDHRADGATGFDFVGANDPGVAGSKMKWGGQLRPLYTLEAYDWQFWAHRFAARQRLAQPPRAPAQG